MISKQNIVVIIVAVLTLFLVLPNVSRLVPESQNYQNYTTALRRYNNSQFLDAYHSFGAVSRFSKLKAAAIYRQALCAEKLGDEKTETKKYKEVIRYYPNSILAQRAKYLKAQQSFDLDKFKRAQKEFKDIVSRYPNTDYAIASQYYLGSIEMEKSLKIKNKKKRFKTQKKAVQFFKAYLKTAPSGRFSVNCVEKWTSLNLKLTNEDNLLIAHVYQENQDYKKAEQYLRTTNISVSWPYFVKNAYAQKDYSRVKYYTQLGLRGTGSDAILINEDYDENTENKNIYDAIDLYLKISNDPKTSLSYLLSLSKQAKGYDYLLYKSCNNLPAATQTACFNSLFYKYPDGQFAAEALSNIFYSKVRSRDYFTAKKLARIHLSKFADTNSAPRVVFWLAKIAERTKNYEEARSYYRNLIRQYPDNYYAYRAFLNINRFSHFQVGRLKALSVKFPYKNSNYSLLTDLAKVKDYGLINQLCKEDEFIQSWLAYLEGDFSSSARIARDAMDDLSRKPDRLDYRWRLVYPIHYYDLIEKNARAWGNDPILILSIIREESYFNPMAHSPVGASGLMQLMPLTARDASKVSGINLSSSQMLFEPSINIQLGNVYYSQLRKFLLDKDALAVLAYNGGIGSVSNWKDTLNYVDIDDLIEQIPYQETQNYLKKVFRSYWNYLRTYTNINF